MNIIEKSDNDNRNYSWIELDNKLKVILIEDNLNKNCGALLNIKIGSIHDTIHGIAHFLEHMVFMGSEKYPDVNNFFDNISKSGGNTNAMTSDTDTTYYFTIDSINFMSLLDMFVQFFISPLLNKEYIKKEINSVDSESIKNILDENWISQEMIKKTLYDDFPINHFTCGNKNTLSINNIDKKVRDFFDKYYSSNLMHLILYINKDIDKKHLLKYIEDTFTKIKNKNLPIERKFGEMLKTGHILKYIPNKNTNNLIICTQIKKDFINLIDSPLDILFWILSNKSDNSLFKLYEKYNYIEDMSIGEFFTYDDYSLIVAKINLTKDGYENYDNIIKIYFEYIDSIKNNNSIEKIYEDIININKNSYKFIENDDIVDTLLDINQLLINKIDPLNLLNFKILKPKFSDIKDKFINLIKDFKLYNSTIILGSLENKLINKCHDEIYNLYYSINKLEPIKIEKNKYKIINQNKYIISNLELISDIENRYPEKIDKKYNLFYNFNQSFKIPDVNIYICLDIPSLYETPEIYAKVLLYLDTICSDNTNIINNISQSGNKLHIKIDFDTIFIYLSGNNKIIDKIVDDFNEIYNNANGTCYNTVKNKIYKLLKNSINDQVIRKINYLIYKKINKKSYDNYDLIKYIKNTNYNDCKDTFFNIRKNCTTSIFISGNINKEDSIRLCDKLYSYLNIATELKPDFNKNIRKKQTPYVRIYSNKNEKEKNTLFTLLYEIFSIKKTDNEYAEKIAFLILLDSISNIQYFNSLRTDDQLGYIVYTKIVYLGNKNVKNGFLKFVIQSPNENAEKLYEKTYDFIKNKLNNFIMNLGEAGIKTYINGEIANLSNKFNNLSELDLYYCSVIFDYSYNFNYKEDIIEALQNITFNKFIEMFNLYILNNDNIYSISIDPYNKNDKNNKNTY
jgi:secreted Zn-dependent insulinase-like peptidase